MGNSIPNTPTWWTIDHLLNQHAEVKELLLSLLSKHKLRPNKEDRLMWFPSPDGKYTIKFYYKCFARESSSPWPPSIWSKIWKNRAWTKAKFFLWLATHDKFLSIEQLYKHGWPNLFNCLLCGMELEKGRHLLLHYAFSFEIQSKLFDILSTTWLMPDSIGQLILSWQCPKHRKVPQLIWNVAPMMIVWNI